MADNSFTSNFKYSAVWFIKCILMLFAVIVTAKIIGNKYASASTENQVNNFSEARWNEFYSLPKNSVDMLFVGSSHSYCTFDPEIVDSALGTSSYQLGMPLQHMDSTYFTVLEALNYQKPKNIVCEVYWDMLDDDFELIQAGYLFQVLKNKELELKYIKEVFPLSEKIKYACGIFRYQADYFAYRSSEINEEIENTLNVTPPDREMQTGTEKYKARGYTYCDYNMLKDEYDKTNQFKNLDGKNVSLSKKQLYWLKKLTELCKQKDITLTFVTAPIANPSIAYIKNYSDIHEKIQSFADENNIKYLDFNLPEVRDGLFKDENFRDDAHLNHSGVLIADRYFCEWFKSEYLPS
ncbi:MAG TPA: hypothetical protein DCG28_05095 [Lachnospiraceae bacterium]|nr:hypothetical protein [Lachnospiraceae bacterium]